jgi:replicative DNA helicase
MADLDSIKKPKTMRRFADVTADYIAALDARNNGERHYVLSGFKNLDRKFGGWLHDGHLVILAGRPAMGKSALAQQIAENVASDGKTAILLSLEMSSYELVERSISRRSSISVPVLKIGVLTDDEWGRVSMAMQQTMELPILVDDASFDIAGLIAKTKAAAGSLEKAGLPPLGLVVVDYLQLVTGKGLSRTMEVGQVSGGLKRLAKELKTPVLALSQLNRGVESRVEKRPTLADLRESGSIEQDADLVLFVYRDEYYNEDSQDKGVAEIIAAKNRHGETGTAKLVFVGERIMFGDLA